MRSISTLLSLLILYIAGVTAYADPAPFDLAGPDITARVTRSGKTLPLSKVPSLASGDRLWIKAELPASQSAQYLLVVAFLHGATNPPPQEWFFKCNTWGKKGCAKDGLTLTIPEDARQVLVFLAPVTGGDFNTLVDAVRGRPGAFVRTSQDLNQATLDRSRLENYLSAIRSLNAAAPQRIKTTVPILARSLAISVEEKCFDKIPELQLPCLTQGRESLILNDGHSASIVEALTTGAARDLAMEASFTPELSYGHYSPYVASILDIGRIFSSFRTARYQYIPALAAHRAEHVSLMLNTPPSFHNPKSVLVAALPAIEQTQPPPLHPVNAEALYCARKTSLVLPVEGAPLIFSTQYAYDTQLRLRDDAGRTIDLPARADAQQGGYVVDTSELASVTLGDRIQAQLHGEWGFEPYEGPTFDLVNARPQTWRRVDDDNDSLIVGRAGVAHLKAASVACVEEVFFKGSDGTEQRAQWSANAPDRIEVRLPLQDAQPGPISLTVRQYGLEQAETVPLQAFAELAKLERFTLHAGDRSGILRGSRLDEVARLSMDGIEFMPAGLVAANSGDELTMTVQDPQKTSGFNAGKTAQAEVALADGRIMKVKAVIESPRPSAVLIAKSVLPSPALAASNLRLANSDELPQEATLTFSLRSQYPAAFTRDETVEIATADESARATLGFSDGSLTLIDNKVAVATLDPAKAFGASAFGPLRFRIVARGVAGEWQPLAVLVRLPVLTRLQCPASPDFACKLSGTRLFLVDSISSDPKFEHPVEVPEGFTGSSLSVPHPGEGQLYVKLRDNPTTVDTAALTAEELAQ
jgi:hypothetical protein